MMVWQGEYAFTQILTAFEFNFKAHKKKHEQKAVETFQKEMGPYKTTISRKEGVPNEGAETGEKTQAANATRY